MKAGNVKTQKGFFSVGVGLAILAIFGGITLGTDGAAKNQDKHAKGDTVAIERTVAKNY